MPRGPKGEKRPADVIGNAVHVMRIATGEEPEDYGGPPESEGMDPAAVARIVCLFPALGASSQ
jgi:hypothetical protein